MILMTVLSCKLCVSTTKNIMHCLQVGRDMKMDKHLLRYAGAVYYSLGYTSAAEPCYADFDVGGQENMHSCKV